MLKFFLIPLFALVIFTALLGAYLTPDDLSGCNTEPTQKTKCQSADAIVAVSGGNTSVRAAEAINLYKHGWGKYLIFSGAAMDVSSPSNAEVMKLQAVAAGVPDSAIITEDFARTTHQNAEKVDSVIEKYNIHRLIVVTSPYHQRRAGLEFKKFVGPSVQVVNHPAKNDPDWPVLWWLTPRGWWLAGGEFVKIIAFHAGESQ